MIALNYSAKSKGVHRGMTVYEAMAAVPELMLVHVSTFEVLEDEPIQIEQRKQFWVNLEQKDREK